MRNGTRSAYLDYLLERKEMKKLENMRSEITKEFDRKIRSCKENLEDVLEWKLRTLEETLLDINVRLSKVEQG